MTRRVLQLIDSFDRGGTELQTLQLATLLRASGRYEVELGCLRAEGPLLEEAARLGFNDVPEFRLDSFYNANAVRQAARFRRYVRERDIGVVHANDFYTNVFGMVCGRAAGVPVRIASRRETSGMRTMSQRFVEKRAFDLAHVVVANANAVRDQVIQEGLRASKVVTIHNGLDASRYVVRKDWPEHEWRDRLGIPRNRPVVTIVANLRHDVKDHRMFLRGAQAIHARIPSAVFVLAGEGPLMEPMRALAATSGIATSTLFLGRCVHVRELLALSSVCALTSRAEGLSNAILEYMAAGRPVVATAVGGARETVIERETGFLVRSGDVAGFAARVCELLADPVRASAMGASGRQQVVTNFSLDARREKTEALYDALIQREAGDVAE